MTRVEHRTGMTVRIDVRVSAAWVPSRRGCGADRLTVSRRHRTDSRRQWATVAPGGIAQEVVCSQRAPSSVTFSLGAMAQ